tara:strand:+ start:172946 stop:173614 length:669 start_codon:yes stop_codon:yes gene_type:complete
MREIVLDTETTGFNPEDGHKIVEIGAIEVINRLPTGRSYHQYINPEREIDASAIRVHGITNEKVSGMPIFSDIAQDFLDFIAGDPIVAHNAQFDVRFLNHELNLADFDTMPNEVVDTLAIAREQFPGSQVSLDALCRRFEVDLSDRTFHGALLDAQLLAAVYLELTGGQQPILSLDDDADDDGVDSSKYKKTLARAPRGFSASAEELAAHQAFIDKIQGNMW